jgi:hypothetical protein
MGPQPARYLPSLAIALALGVAAPVLPEDLTAVLTQFQGNVTVTEAAPRRGRAAFPVPRPVRFLQIVGSGDALHVPTGAGAGFVCSTDRWVDLPGGKDQPLTQALCRAGKPLPPGTYRRLAPAAGRMVSLKRALVLEGETRGNEDEDFGVPILLSPRRTAVLGPRPSILWTQVPDATEYELEMMGTARFRLGLDAAKVACGGYEGEVAVCSSPYPAQAPDLPAGAISFLRIGARRGLATPLRTEAEPSRIQRLSTQKAEEVRAGLESSRNLPLDEAARQLLEADLYAREGLFADAIVAYGKASNLRDAPEIRVTLGDAYLQVGLFRLAARTYQDVLDKAPSLAIQAAAEMGLGKIEYARRHLERAACHFRKARDLYRSLGLKEDAEVADRAARQGKKSRQE